MYFSRAAFRGTLASLLIAVSLLPAGTAQSATANCGTALTQFTGFGYFPTGSPSYVGTDASITVRNMALCSTVTDPHFNFTYTWIMIASFNGQGGYAQSGFYRGYGQSAVHAVEDNPDGTGPVRRRYLGHPVYGTANSYQVRPGTSSECSGQPGGVTNCDLELVQGVVYQATNFAPASRWSTPYSNQYFGETKYPGSDMPGTSTARTTFSSIDVYALGVGFIGSAPQNSVSNENARSHLTSYSNSSFSLWSG